MVVAAAAVFCSFGLFMLSSKANLLSKNKEPQQTTVTQVSPPSPQKSQTQNLAQQILSALNLHVQ